MRICFCFFFFSFVSFFFFFFFFSSRRRHTRSLRDWSSDVCSSDLSFLPPLVFRYRHYSPCTEEETLSQSLFSLVSLQLLAMKDSYNQLVESSYTLLYVLVPLLPRAVFHSRMASLPCYHRDTRSTF